MSLVDVLEIGVLDSMGERCVRSRMSFQPGDLVASFYGKETRRLPTRMTLQISADEHIDLAPELLQLINHSCEPNVYFDVVHRHLVAIAPIAIGDQVMFFYPSTEWTMASPFDCRCQSARCLARIAGASQVSPRMLRAHRLAPHIEFLLGEANWASPQEHRTV